MTGCIYRDILKKAFVERKTVVIRVSGGRSFSGRLIKNTTQGGILSKETTDSSSRVEKFGFRLFEIEGLTLIS